MIHVIVGWVRARLRARTRRGCGCHPLVPRPRRPRPRSLRSEPVNPALFVGSVFFLFVAAASICHWLDTHPRKDHHS